MSETILDIVGDRMVCYRPILDIGCMIECDAPIIDVEGGRMTHNEPMIIDVEEGRIACHLSI